MWTGLRAKERLLRLSPIIVVLAIATSVAGAFITPLTSAQPNGVSGSVVVGAGVVEAAFTLNVTQAPVLLYIPAPGNVTYCTAYEEGFGDLFTECGFGYVNVSVLEPGTVNVTYASQNATVERGALIVTWVFLPVTSIVQIAGLVLVDFSGANATLVSASELVAGPGNLTLYMTSNVSTSSVTTTTTTSTSSSVSSTYTTTTTAPSTTTTLPTSTTSTTITTTITTTSAVTISTTSTTTTSPITSATTTSTTSAHATSSTTTTTTTTTTTVPATETTASQTTSTVSTPANTTSYTTSSSVSSSATTPTTTSPTSKTTASTSLPQRAPAIGGLYVVGVVLAVLVALVAYGLLRRGGRP